VRDCAISTDVVTSATTIDGYTLQDLVELPPQGGGGLTAVRYLPPARRCINRCTVAAGPPPFSPKTHTHTHTLNTRIL